ncbi:MAG: DUF547 domain-containing protein [Kiloniellales bacterium]|nr:DUF547 domain-containing protein [Kiloniellales bacterium]
MKRLLQISLLVVFSSFLVGISSFEALFAPSKQIWVKWTENDPFSETKISHNDWSDLLSRYLVEDASGLNRFNYGAVSQEDRRKLKRYLAGLESIPISRYRKEEQLAYWINLYNALTLDVVLDHYPVKSILEIDISPGLFGRGPWGKKLITVEGEALTLNDIEHRILRPIWDDPRIHYAVNCASVGCPNLQGRAFEAESMEEMLDAAAVEFINSPRAFWRIDDGVAVSSIYAWFQEDFGDDDAGIISHMKRYANKDLADLLNSVEKIADHDYDWSLNDAAESGDS